MFLNEDEIAALIQLLVHAVKQVTGGFLKPMPRGRG